MLWFLYSQQNLFIGQPSGFDNELQYGQYRLEKEKQTQYTIILLYIYFIIFCKNDNIIFSYSLLVSHLTPVWSGKH